nr:molybdopterin-synthase adenylyltransferase MoeB [Haemophilus parahaemolyticus]
MELTDHEMLRYNRQISLKAVDFDGQEKLKESRVLIVGAGGLGCSASQYLASAGVGKIILVDFDTISLSNLQRQILYTDADIGKPKAEVAKVRLQSINPNIEVQAVVKKCDDAEFAELIRQVDVVVDCTDNVDVRNQLNLQCFEQKRPLISGSAIRFEGQISVFTYAENEACYQCLSQLFGSDTLSCVEAGVISPIVGVIGSLQALETIKVLLDIGKTLSGKLLIIDGLHFSVREMNLPKMPSCKVCTASHSIV